MGGGNLNQSANEFMYELLKRMQERFDRIDFALGEVKSEINSIRGTILSIHGDIHNIYGVLARHDTRFDRIERRLDLRELAEAQRIYETAP
jgi:hypothetical protein